jgi:L-seryl-tRNA(Ser) seleniumtransferase
LQLGIAPANMVPAIFQQETAMSRDGGVNATRRPARPASGIVEAGDADAVRRPGVYESLGLKYVINATGTFTDLGGSIMPPEVVAAWAEAARHFVDLVELQDRVGARIAELVGAEAAMVTTGAAGALLLGTAAAVTRGDPKLIARLPDTTGIKNEVILQKSHHSGYDNQLTNVGVKLIEVRTVADVERKVNDRTALFFFMNIAEADGEIGREQWVTLARRHKVPTLLDAAADTPPVGRLSEYTKMGFDLVAFSGGKAIRGPNDTGMLLGRNDLIAAAKLNANPHEGTIGRMMKVGKEDMIALLAAVERFLRLDHEAEWREFERRLGVIENSIKDIPTIECERIVPAVANHVPHMVIDWDTRRLKITHEEVTRKLAAGDPPIRIGRVPGTGTKGILISVLMLQDGEEHIVADRLAAILKQAAD